MRCLSKNPCYECPERAFGCHGGCKRYLQWKSEQMPIKKIEQANREKDYDLNSYHLERQERVRKATRR